MLHYRIIGFYAPVVHKTNNNLLEIAIGYYHSEDSFKKNIIVSQKGDNSKTIAEVPAFGKTYTWRMTFNSGSTNEKSELHHFSTIMDPKVDTANVRCRITKSAEKYKDAYVFYDNNRVLYDMNGRPVWYLPDVKGLCHDENAELCDLKISGDGNITFILCASASEINYNGDMLWEAPNTGAVSGDSAEHYHHELTKLSNGHYMMLGKELVLTKIKENVSNDNHLLSQHGTQISQDSLPAYIQKGYMPIPYGTIIEYDQQGNLVWSWKLSKYFQESPANYFKPPEMRGGFEPHENSFYFDEKNKVVYLSLRNMSRIIKIKYPEGIVLHTYGPVYKNNSQTGGDDLFCQQHNPRISENGYLYLFNNNTCNNQEGIPKIVMMEEPGPGNDHLKKVWEYDCAVEVDYKKTIATGGNVTELPDGSMFACMGKQYGTTFIVSRDKKILWSAIPEKWNADQNKWEMIPQYRASIISSRSELEKLIWNNENKTKE